MRKCLAALALLASVRPMHLISVSMEKTSSVLLEQWLSQLQLVPGSVLRTVALVPLALSVELLLPPRVP